MHTLDDDPCVTHDTSGISVAIDGEVEECECSDSLLSASDAFTWHIPCW